MINYSMLFGIVEVGCTWVIRVGRYPRFRDPARCCPGVVSIEGVSGPGM